VGSFDSLGHRNFRLLWTGALISNVGTWMQSTALAWYVFELTHSAFWVSFVSFINLIPLVLAPLGGVYSDRVDRKRILFVTQTLMMVDAAVLAVLAWAGHAGLAVVLVLTFGQGLAFAFNGPAWLAWIPSLVPPGSLVNAVALNSAQFSAARVVGPAIAGGLIAAFGPGLVFGLNAVSFVAVLVALALIDAPRTAPLPRERTLDFLRSGVTYAWRHRRIRTMLITVAVVAFFGSPILALMPIYAHDVFHRGSGSYGVLLAAIGLGAVTGALALGRYGTRLRANSIPISTVVTGVLLVAFGAAGMYAVAIVVGVAYGAANLFVNAAANSDIQLHVDEGVRGRVLSIYMVAFGAAFPIGSLVAGAAAVRWGAPATTIAGAFGCVAWGAILLLRSPDPSPRAALEPGG